MIKNLLKNKNARVRANDEKVTFFFKKKYTRYKKKHTFTLTIQKKRFIKAKSNILRYKKCPYFFIYTKTYKRPTY